MIKINHLVLIFLLFLESACPFLFSIKQIFQECWAISDNKTTFASALKNHGYTLAKGDRRGFVALDHRCEIFAVAKWSGVKAKDVKLKLGDTENLPSVTYAKTQIAQDMRQRLTEMKEQQKTAINMRLAIIKSDKLQLIERHKKDRQTLKSILEMRQAEEIKHRQARYNKGMRGIFDRIVGKHTRIKKQNEQESLQALRRDTQEKDQLIYKQLEQSQKLQKRADRLQKFQHSKDQSFDSDIKQYQNIEYQRQELFKLRVSKHKHQMTIKPTLVR